jgi:hypothetical protein
MIFDKLHRSFYIIVFFWEVAGEKRESKSHRKAHAAPSAAAARVQSAARPPGVATRVALVYVDETPLLQQHETAMDLGFAPEVPVATKTPKFDGELHLRVGGCDISAKDVMIEALRTRCLSRLGCCARGRTAGGSDPLLVEGVASHSSEPRRLESARGHNLAATSNAKLSAVPGALALLPRPMGVLGMQARLDFQDLLSLATNCSLAMMAFAGMTFMPTAVIGMFFHTAFPLYVFVNVIDTQTRFGFWDLVGFVEINDELLNTFLRRTTITTMSAAKDKELLLDMIFCKVSQD